MRSVKLFLASPLALKDDRQQIEILVNRKNAEWVHNGRRLEFISSDFGTASTYETRTQDHYNLAIQGADLFVLLFSTHIGDYTQEEFDVAVRHAQSARRPRILVYWRDESVRLGDLDIAGVERVLGFRKRLETLELFYTKYSTPAEMVSHLSRQLDMVWSTLAARLDSLQDLTSLTIEIDEGLLGSVRGMRVVVPALRAQTYRAILHDAFAARGLSCADFLNGGLGEAARGSKDAAMMSVGLNVEMSPSVDHLTYKTSDFELHVENPVLMWHCSCGALTDGSGEPDRRGSCAIHSVPEGDTLTRLYRSTLIRTSFDGVEVLWKRSPEVWPPTVDSFSLYRDIDNDGGLRRPARSVLDLGCGTGILGLLIGMKNPDVRRIYLADWLLTPLAYSVLAAHINAPKLVGRSVTCLLGMHTLWIDCPQPVGKVDLCVCNPPYLPIFDEFDRFHLSHTVAGTELLEHVVEHAGQIATTTYIGFSDVALPEATRAAQRGNRVLQRVGEGHTVPFTVPQAFQNPDYFKRLVDEGKVIDRDDGRFRWWHTIRTYRIDSR